MQTRLARTAILCLALISANTAFPQTLGHPLAVVEKVLATARAMIGRPYKFTGDSPVGFDCSGLVRYSYLAAGMDLPHGTSELRQLTRHIAPSRLRQGDLLFFDINGNKYSHVGIYAGDKQFIHAPSAGKQVRVDTLLDPYWKQHFTDARRLQLILRKD